VCAPTATCAYSAPTTLAPGFAYGAVSIGSNQPLTLNAGVYQFASLQISSPGSGIVVASGPITVYITGLAPAGTPQLDLTGGSVANSTGAASNLVFLCENGVTSVSLAGGATADFGVYAPNAAITVTGGGTVYGAVSGKSISIAGGSTVYYDRSLATLAVGGFTCGINEISRASPIVATINGNTAIVQGSFVTPTGGAPPQPRTVSAATDLANFVFPYITGHLRARDREHHDGSERLLRRHDAVRRRDADPRPIKHRLRRRAIRRELPQRVHRGEDDSGLGDDRLCDDR
jgi:hypothetical protein